MSSSADRKPNMEEQAVADDAKSDLSSPDLDQLDAAWGDDDDPQEQTVIGEVPGLVELTRSLAPAAGVPNAAVATPLAMPAAPVAPVPAPPIPAPPNVKPPVAAPAPPAASSPLTSPTPLAFAKPANIDAIATPALPEPAIAAPTAPAAPAKVATPSVARAPSPPSPPVAPAKKRNAADRVAAKKAKERARVEAARERKRARAEAVAKKQKPKQRRVGAPRAIVKSGDPMDVVEPGGTTMDIARPAPASDWRKMAILVAVIVAAGAIAIALLRK